MGFAAILLLLGLVLVFSLVLRTREKENEDEDEKDLIPRTSFVALVDEPLFIHAPRP